MKISLVGVNQWRKMHTMKFFLALLLDSLQNPPPLNSECLQKFNQAFVLIESFFSRHRTPTRRRPSTAPPSTGTSPPSAPCSRRGRRTLTSRTAGRRPRWTWQRSTGERRPSGKTRLVSPARTVKTYQSPRLCAGAKSFLVRQYMETRKLFFPMTLSLMHTV